MAHTSRLTPLGRFLQLIRLDGTELAILLCYAFVSGVLALAVPLAAQALVNNIAQGLFWQPLLVLTGAVFLGLALSGLLKLLQFSLAEAVQQRLFARLGLRLTELLPRFDYREFVRHHGPQELNKFFEIVNVQKSWNKLLLAVPSSLVETVLSLAFLALYGPNVLSLCLAAMAVAGLVMVILGYGGLRTSLRASHAKYELAGWLEQIGRSQAGLKLSSLSRYLLARSDVHVEEYLKHRQAHYGVLLRQLFTFYAFQAVVSAGVLGMGGWLVVQREISLGQLVAIELVVLNLLKAGEKLVSSIPPFYALLTGLVKLDHLLSLPADHEGGTRLAASTRGAELKLSNVTLEDSPLVGCNLHIQPNERVSVIGAESCGRSTLALLALGLVPPRSGLAEIDGVRVASLCPAERSAVVGWIEEHQELLNTTVEENIRLGRDITPHDLRWAVELSGLHQHLPRLPKGLETEVLCGGLNLSSAQRLRILLARVVVGRPRLLVIDHNFYSMDFERRIRTVQGLFAAQHRWTILNLVSETESLALSDRIVWLRDGELVDLGSPRESLDRADFVAEFPNLTARLRSRLEAR